MKEKEEKWKTEAKNRTKKQGRMSLPDIGLPCVAKTSLAPLSDPKMP